MAAPAPDYVAHYNLTAYYGEGSPNRAQAQDYLRRLHMSSTNHDDKAMNCFCYTCCALGTSKVLAVDKDILYICYRAYCNKNGLTLRWQGPEPEKKGDNKEDMDLTIDDRKGETTPIKIWGQFEFQLMPNGMIWHPKSKSLFNDWRSMLDFASEIRSAPATPPEAPPVPWQLLSSGNSKAQEEKPKKKKTQVGILVACFRQ